MAGFSFKSGSMSNRDLRPLYIIIIPLIVLIIILNSGYMQKWLTAVSVRENSYTSAEYNYFYFSEYIEFLAANEERLEEIGFDTSISESKQMYDENTSYRDYFIGLADRRLQETAYYYDLAMQEGYEFSQEELAPIQEKLDEIEKDRAYNSLSLENYLVAYYGAGMTEETFVDCLSKYVKAKAYKNYLQKIYIAPAIDTQDWLANHPEVESYPTANLRMITLKAKPNRFTNEVGEEELLALKKKLSDLQERFLNDPESFTDLANAFCEDSELLKDNCVLESVQKDELSSEVSAWVFAEERKSGESNTFIDEQKGCGYLVIYDGSGENAQDIAAHHAVVELALDGEFEAACEKIYAVNKKTLGMKFVGK